MRQNRWWCGYYVKGGGTVAEMFEMLAMGAAAAVTTNSWRDK